jgi:hypothetical protein
MNSDLTAAIVLFVLLIVFFTHRPPPPRLPVSHEDGITTPVQWNDMSESRLGHYQRQARDLCLQRDVINLSALRLGKADVMEPISADIEQLGFILNPQLASQPISERHAAILAKQIESIKDRLDAVEKELGLE